MLSVADVREHARTRRVDVPRIPGVRDCSFWRGRRLRQLAFGYALVGSATSTRDGATLGFRSSWTGQRGHVRSVASAPANAGPVLGLLAGIRLAPSQRGLLRAQTGSRSLGLRGRLSRLVRRRRAL